METVRQKWTDERLDDLKDQVVTGFDRVHKDLQGIRGEVAAAREGLRREMSDEFAAVRAEMAANHRLLVQLILGTIGTVIVSFLGLVGVLLSHA
jgi:hypothetical protein